MTKSEPQDTGKDTKPRAKRTPPKTGKGVGTGKGALTNAQRHARDLEVVRLWQEEDMTLRKIAVTVKPPFADQHGPAEALNRILKQQVGVEAATYRELLIDDLLELKQVLKPYFSADYIADDIETIDTRTLLIVRERIDKQLAAVDRRIKINKRLAEITGADMPTKQEISGDGTVPFLVQMNWPSPDPNTVVHDEADLAKGAKT